MVRDGGGVQRPAPGRESMRMRAVVLGGCFGLAMLLAVSAGTALAQPAAGAGGLKVAWVDVPKALKGTKAAEAAIAQLKGEFERKKGELQAKADAIATKEREIEAQGAALTEDALKEKKRQLEDMRREAARFQSDARDEMSRREASVIQDQMKTLLKAVRELGGEGGYDLIFQVSRERIEEAGLLTGDDTKPIFDPGAGLVYADPGLDITPQVIERMNVKAP